MRENHLARESDGLRSKARAGRGISLGSQDAQTLRQQHSEDKSTQPADFYQVIGNGNPGSPIGRDGVENGKPPRHLVAWTHLDSVRVVDHSARDIGDVGARPSPLRAGQGGLRNGLNESIGLANRSS